MLFKAMDQFLNDVEWGELDYLVVDLPPGTGDVVLTLAQKTPVDSAIVVSTPQSLAISEVKKAIMMFKQMNVPVKAFVQNMSGFEVEGKTLALFPEGKNEAILESYGVSQTFKIPFDPKIGVSAEAGVPYTSALKEKTKTQSALNELCDVLK